MYKLLSKTFGVLTLFFGLLFLCVKFLSLKTAFLKKDENEEKAVAVGANNNFLKDFVLKCAGAVAPIYAVAKVKAILHDHKKAKRRRKLYSIAGLSLVALGLRKKHIKLKSLKV